MPATIQKILKPTKYRAVDTSTSTQIISQNLVTNGDFASDITGWDAVDVGDGETAPRFDANDGVSNGGCCEILVTDGGYIGIKQNIPFIAGRKYRVSVSAKAASGDNGKKFRFMDNGSSSVSALHSTKNNKHALTESHATYTSEWTADENSDRIYIVRESTGTFEFFVDNIEIVEIESFSNNNHGQIYSGRGLEFDGVSDYAEIPDVDAAKPTDNFTIACWVNIASTSGTWKTIYGKSSFGSGIWFAIDTSEHLVCGIKDVVHYTNFKTVSGSIPINTWVRCVVTYERTGTTCKGVIYLNGVAVELNSGGYEINESSTGVTATSAGHTNDSYRLGLSNTYYMDGKMSDFQMWHATWSESDVLYDYLNPESLVLNNGSTSLTESNLKLWYPMQDGHSRGEQTFIMDGANTGLGEELISDISASAWTKGTAGGSTVSSTITDNSDGSVTFETAETSDWQTVSIPIVNEQGVSYKVSITGESLAETDGDSNDKFYWRFGNTYNDGHSTDSFNTSFKISEGAHTKTLYFESAESNNPAFLVGMFKKASDTVHKFRLDSVSIKAVNQKHHATTLFTSPTELWDGADNSTTNWDATSPASVTASADCLKIITGHSSTGPNIDLRDSKDLTTDLTIGRTYRITGQGASDVAGNAVTMQANISGTDQNSNSITVNNILSNGNFETGSGADGAGYNFDNWIEQDTGAGEIASDASNQHNGSRCVKLTTSTDGVNVYQTISSGITAGDKYLLTYWSKNEHASSGSSVRHKVYDNTAGADIVATANSGNETTGWVQTAVQFTIPANCTSIFISFNSPSSNYYVLVDDVVCTKFVDFTLDFRADSTTTNELRAVNMHGANESVQRNFETLTLGTSTDNWLSDAQDDSLQSVLTLSSQTDVNNETTNVMKVAFTDSATVGYATYKKTDYIVGEKYYMRVKAKDIDGTGITGVQCFASESIGGETESGTAVNPASDGVNDWDTVNGNFTATNSTMYINIKITGANTADYVFLDDFIIMHQERVWIDDISVKEIGIASGWTNADQQLDIPQLALQSYSQLAWFLGSGSGEGATLDSAITTGTNNWSMSFWIFKQENNENFDFFMGNSTTLNFAFDNNSNRKLYYRDQDENYHSISDAAIPDNEWVHIVITVIGNTSMTAYVNGQAQDTDTGMNGTSLYLTRFMTGYAANQYETLGCINEIAYFANRAIGESNVQQLYNGGKAYDARNITDGNYLTHYWRNNGLAEWKDLVGTNDINVNSTTTLLLPAGVDPSRDNQGFVINRQKDTNTLNFPTAEASSPASLADNYVNVEASEGLNNLFSDGGSVSCWIYPFGNGESDLGRIFAHGGNYLATGSAHTDNTIHLTFEADWSTTNGVWSTSSRFVSLFEWTHVLITYNGSATGNHPIIYINGSKKTVGSGLASPSSTPAGSLTAVTGSFLLGNNGSFIRQYDGKLDDVLVYSDIIDDNEAIRIYNAGKRNHRNPAS